VDVDALIEAGNVDPHAMRETPRADRQHHTILGCCRERRGESEPGGRLAQQRTSAGQPEGLRQQLAAVTGPALEAEYHDVLRGRTEAVGP